MGTGGNQNGPGYWQILGRLGDRARQWREKFDLTPTQAMGRKGEDIAHRYLKGRGLHIIARRFRLPDGSGEVDIIARDKEVLVFVEVKTRRTQAFGGPERAIDPEKQRKLIRAARSYVSKAGANWSRIRFDIVTVILEGSAIVTHYEDAFFPGRTI